MISLCGSECFEYKSGGLWHQAGDHSGRLDVFGVEEVRLITYKNGNETITCKNTVETISTWASRSISCETLLQSHILLNCGVTVLYDVYYPQAQLQCDTLSTEPYVEVTASMKCSGYDYPTNKIKDAHTCSFHVLIKPSWHVFIEFCGHCVGMSLLMLTLCFSINKRGWRGTQAIKKIVLHIGLYFLHIPLLMIAYFQRSMVQVIIFFFSWCTAVIWYCATAIVLKNL